MLIYRNQSNKHIYPKNYFERDKKDVLLLFPDDTSVGQELGKKMCVSASFCVRVLALKKN